MANEVVRVGRPGNVTFQNVQILFRNFAGKEGQYNREGDRNFAMIIDDPKVAHQMIEDMWNVKHLRPRDEGDEPKPYIQVAVSYKIRPPRVHLISGGYQVALGEKELEILDWVDIENVDLIINPSPWGPINGKSGIKAYLAAIYITMRQDELELKYEHIPMYQGNPEESAQAILGSTGTPLAIEVGEDPNIIDAEVVDDDEPY